VVVTPTVLGCGGKTDVAPRVFVGPTEGTDARIALVTTGDGSTYAEHGQVGRVHMSGGPSSLDSLTFWGELYLGENGNLSLHPSNLGLDPQYTLTAKATGDSISGTFNNAQSGPTVHFTATETAPGELAGLYEARAACGHIGVVLMPGSKAAAPDGVGSCNGSSNSEVLLEPPLNVEKDGSIVVTTSDGEQVAATRVGLEE
jgi:hypothetical protein